MTTMGPDINKSALIIVDMQNDFLQEHDEPDGLAEENPGLKVDREFLRSTIPNVKKLSEAFRRAGRPIVYIVHAVKPDYSDAAFPFWRHGETRKRKIVIEGTWGAQIVDELTPQKGDHLVIKKGFGGFGRTPLDTILRNLGVNTCIVSGVTTCVCVSTTIRGGVELNYRMIVVSDATAEVQQEMHEAELKTMARVFADVKSTGEVMEMLRDIKKTA